MSKKITDLGTGVPGDSSLGFIGDPNSGALSKATFLSLKSYFQSGSSLLLTGSYVTTGSFNQLSSSYHIDSSSFTSIISNTVASQSGFVLTSSYLPFSASSHTDSGSFDTRLKAISGSLLTGSFVTTLAFNVYSASSVADSASFDGRIKNVFSSESNFTTTSSFNNFSGSHVVDSSSFNARINNVFASESNYVSTGSFNSFSSSYTGDSSSLNTKIANVFASESNYHPTSSINGNNGYVVIFSGSQGMTFGNLFYSGSSLLINQITGLNNALLQVAGPVAINDTSYLLLPKGTTAQRPSSSIATFPMLRGNSDTTSLEYYNGSQWLALNATSSGGTTGSVTSVGFSLPSIFTVSNSPVLGAGVLSGSLNVQSQGLVFASPAGSTGVPSFRALVLSDITSLTSSFAGNFVLTSSFNVFSSSYVVDSSSIGIRIANVYASESNYTSTASFNLLSSSYHLDSASFLSSIGNVFASESNYTTTASYLAFSGSYYLDSGSFSNRINNVYASESKYLLTSSVNGVNNSYAVFSGSSALIGSSIFQSGSSVIIGSSTGSNGSLFQIAGNITISGSLYDSTNTTGSSGQILISTAGGIMWQSTGSPGWGLSGNNVSASAFLGTINSQDLIFKRNSTQVAVFSNNNCVVIGNGNNSTSGSNASVLGGSNNVANTMAAVVAGGNNIAVGNSSVVIGGQNNLTAGIGSVALGGINLSASAAYSVALGRFNDPISSSTPGSWAGNDPLLILGNGSSTSSLSNALVVYKTGSVSLPYYANSVGGLLTVDNNGNVSIVPDLGKNNYIPLFSGSQALTSSILSQVSNSIAINGGFYQSSSNIVTSQNSLVFGFNSTSSVNRSILLGRGLMDYGVGTGILTVVGSYNSDTNPANVFVIGSGTGPAGRSDMAIFSTIGIRFNEVFTAASGAFISGPLGLSGSIIDITGTTGSIGQVLTSTTNGVQWTSVSGSSLFSNFVLTSSFNVFSASYSVDSSSIVGAIKNISSSILSLTGSYATTGSFNTLSSSINTQIANVYASESNYVFTSSYLTFSASVNGQLINSFASESNYLPSASIKGAVNYIPVFTGNTTLSTGSLYQSGSSTLIGGNTTGSNNAVLQAFGNIYISKSLFDSSNGTGSVNQILTSTPTGIKWVNSGSGGTSVLNFIIGDGQSFTPLSGSTQFSSSANPLVNKTILQFFQEGALFAPVSRSVEWYSFTSSQGIINAKNFTFDQDTFYSILYI